VRLCFAPKSEKSSQHLREGSADLEIGVVSDMGSEVRLQTLFRDHFVGAVRAGHPLESAGVVTLAHYVAFGHVIASRRGRSNGPVDQALAALGLKRTIVAIVPSFPAALAIARASELIALVPASFLPAAQPSSKAGSVEKLYLFELPLTTEPITISQMWHPRLERDPVHRWLRERILEVCRAVAPQERQKSF
jgi:DNA-binding transcriptional LysR family regulator